MKEMEGKKIVQNKNATSKTYLISAYVIIRSGWFQILSVQFTVTAAPSTGPRGTEWASYLDPG